MRAFIIGKGKVGRATQKALGDDIPFHDPNEGCFIDTPNEYDLAIVCVPSLVQGPGDYHHLQDVLEYLSINTFQGIVAIRSTVEPLNITYLSELYNNLDIVLFPEFMKQTIEVSQDTPWVVVIGSNDPNHTNAFALAEFIKRRNVEYAKATTFCTLKEAAAIKLFQNSILAAKVTLFNTLYQYCNEQELNYAAVKTSIGWDPRIGLGHTDVPGPDGMFGFGGHCFPKDMEALISSFRALDLDSTLWESIKDYNQRIRYG